ncbi:MAG: pyridoxine 5'-phosphate synthase [Phycisphaerae bacterium]
MTKLSVNVNKVALLRNSRDLDIPNVVKAAKICIAAGAHGITVHPRPDERHIRRADVFDLAKVVAPVEFNIEGYPDDRYMDIVRQVRPTQATLVPDAPGQRTSDHGWDLVRDGKFVGPIIQTLKGQGIRVSLFVDPVLAQVEQAAAIKADRIELYTEPYARAFAAGDYKAVLDTYVAAARKAVALGLAVNAGHDLNLHNLRTFITAVGCVAEVSIGHALIADAIEMGLAATVKEYLRLLN